VVIGLLGNFDNQHSDNWGATPYSNYCPCVLVTLKQQVEVGYLNAYE
jgi:hypothetical protein